VTECAESESFRPGDETFARELARQLDVLRDNGVDVSVLQAPGALTTGSWPRQLRALGVRGVVVATQGPAAARALPFGVWHYTPHAALPRPRGWFSWLRRRHDLVASHIPGPAIIAFDAQRMATPGSRAWNEGAAALDEAASFHRDGAIQLTTLGELTAQLSEASAPRPQRSILRAA
jgi:hypothetical protein